MKITPVQLMSRVGMVILALSGAIAFIAWVYQAAH